MKKSAESAPKETENRRNGYGEKTIQGSFGETLISVLNSPEDINDELIEAIADNKLDSLTINYEFTRPYPDEISKVLEWEAEQYRTNPFWKAKSFNQPIGNWNTSNVTEMVGMFFHATSYRYPKPRGAE